MNQIEILGYKSISIPLKGLSKWNELELIRITNLNNNPEEISCQVIAYNKTTNETLFNLTPFAYLTTGHRQIVLELTGSYIVDDVENTVLLINDGKGFLNFNLYFKKPETTTFFNHLTGN